MSNYDDYENGYGDALYSEDEYEYEVYDEQSGQWVRDDGYDDDGYDDGYYDEAVYITADGYEYIEDNALLEPAYDEVEEDVPVYEPRWTWRRIAYLLIALVIITSLLIYLILPFLNMMLTPAPPPPPEPAWML